MFMGIIYEPGVLVPYSLRFRLRSDPYAGACIGSPTCIRIIPAEGVMKTRLCIFSFLIMIVFCSINLYAGGRSDAETRNNEVVVYAYDSFVSEWGPGPEIARRFKDETGYTVTLVSCGDAAQVLSRAIIEKKHPRADVLLGIDNTLFDQARNAEILESYKPTGAEDAFPAELRFANDWLLTPYDWGDFSIVFDTASGINPPKSLEDLTKSEYANKLILMDPRMSTPGAGFLAWTLVVYGDAYSDYWRRLKPSILTMAPSWDSGYGLFVSGEAPLVISYTTSPAYHLEYEESTQYQALIFTQGHVRQIEGAGLVRGAKNAPAAKAFIDFLIRTDIQSLLPLTQWMYPVSPAVPLPNSFSAAPRTDNILSVPQGKLQGAIDMVMGILSE